MCNNLLVTLEKVGWWEYNETKSSLCGLINRTRPRCSKTIRILAKHARSHELQAQFMVNGSGYTLKFMNNLSHMDY